jgi:autotransporter-associated beta strand protein
MKTRLRILRLVIALYSAFITKAAFGQTTYVWTNQYPAHLAAGDLNQATNWSPNGVPTSSSGPDANGVYGDEMQFDGLTTGPLNVTENNTGLELPPQGPAGLRIHVTSNQPEPVTISSSVQAPGPMRMNYFAIDAGTGSLVLGNHDTNRLDIIAGSINGQVLGFTNHSATPCMINESVRWRLGGAGAHPFVFAGSGDWLLNNHMRSANHAAIILQKFGPGTVTWIGVNNAVANYPDQLGSPITIGGGTMIWKTSDLVGGSAGNPNIVNNGTLLKYDAPVGVCSVLGNIAGSGPVQMNAGTLTLSGTNTFTGNITLSGGVLVVNSPEYAGTSGPLGIGGTIFFTGGTLGFSATNTFDYSARFSTAAGQAYSFDTGGQNVTFATGLTSSGGTLTKAGSGTLTLSGLSTYDGPTTVSSGKLVFQSSKQGSGDITVAGGAAVGVTATAMQVMPTTLTLGMSSGAALEFNNVTSTTMAPLSPTSLASAGITTIRINSGTLMAGQSYPLLSWTSGAAPAGSLEVPSGFSGYLSLSGNMLLLNVTAVSGPALSFTRTGNSLQFSWNNGFGSFKLQAQTNSLHVGLSTNWADYPGGGGCKPGPRGN